LRLDRIFDGQKLAQQKETFRVTGLLSEHRNEKQSKKPSFVGNVYGPNSGTASGRFRYIQWLLL